MADTIEKVSIIVSKGSLEGIYPALIMANGARAEGIEANLFFTFFGLDAIHKERYEHIKVATVGNPGLHMATMVGGLPGVSSVDDPLHEQEDGEARHPADPRVHRDDRRHRVRALRLQGVGRPVRVDQGRLRSTRSRTSSRSASSTRWPPAARSSSPEPGRIEPEEGARPAVIEGSARGGLAPWPEGPVEDLEVPDDPTGHGLGVHEGKLQSGLSEVVGRAIGVELH